MAQHNADQFLLTTKLAIPPARSGLVARPRLLEQLQAGMAHPLSLLAAPAGFGKTVLLSSFAQQSDIAVGWVSLDSSDNDPTQFWTYVLAALDRLQPGIGQAALSLLRTEQPVAIDTVLIALINALSDLRQQIVLVLDDYHVIEAPPIHDAMTFLLDHLPAQLRLVIASRVDPPLPLARLRVRGQLTELRIDNLRFTLEEAATFLNETMGLRLTADNIATLETRTEGWIAGLQLAALSMQGRKDVSGFVSAFAGSHRYVMDYLVEEVLRQQPEHIQRFLLHTSLLERLNGSLCDAVTGQANGRKTLEELEQANLFLIPLDEERYWYRYHHLFADTLRYRLSLSQPEIVPELHQRASAWFERNGLIVEAVHSALAAHDFPNALRLIGLIATAMIERGEYVTLLRWLETLPEDVLYAHPALCLRYAWILLFTGRVDAYERPLQIAEQAWQAEDNRPMLGRVYHFRMNMARLQGDAARTIPLAQQALSFLPEDDGYNRGSCLVALGASYLLLGQLAEAEQYLREGGSISRAAGGLITALLAINYLGDMQIVQGKLREAVATYRNVIGQTGERLLWQVAEANIGLARVLHEWNRLEEAAQHVEQAMVLARETQREVYFAPGYIVLAQLLQAQGETAQASETLDKAVEVARRLGHLPWLRRANALQARLHLAQGNLPMVERWRAEAGIDASDEPTFERESEYLVLARLSIAQEKQPQAIKLLERLLQADATAGRTGAMLQVLALNALAYQASGDSKQAMATLERLLLLSEPEGYTRLFVDEGPAMQKLLVRYLALATRQDQRDGKHASLDYAQKLLAAFPRQEMAHTPTNKSIPPAEKLAGESPLLEPLSAREQEVLELLAAGLSNAAIAERLVVTVGTVKTHMKSIYGKLGVHSRTQAIVRAREANLL